MKKIFVFILLFTASFAHAQPVARKVIAEHFTNTHCSICAIANPGFYTNLRHYPQVLHIAYHPSSPYPTCPLNIHNPAGNDARAVFYSVYGSTPRVVINGTALTQANSLTDSNIFVSQLGQTSPYSIAVSLTPSGTDSMTVRTVVRKVAADTLPALQLYGAVAEDTLFFNAANGETQHYDVFRKAVWADNPVSIPALVNTGDSAVSVKNIFVNPLWKRQRMYAVIILHDDSKNLLQAERSNLLPAVAAGISSLAVNTMVAYPNPAADVISVPAAAPGNAVLMTDISGKKIMEAVIDENRQLNVLSLPAGTYYLLLHQDKERRVLMFVKQ